MPGLVVLVGHMDNVGGDDVSDLGDVPGGNTVSSEDVDKVSVDMAGLDESTSEDIPVDVVDHVVELLARDSGSSEVSVSRSDDSVSEHASNHLEDIGVGPLVDSSRSPVEVPKLPVFTSPGAVHLVESATGVFEEAPLAAPSELVRSDQTRVDNPEGTQVVCAPSSASLLILNSLESVLVDLNEAPDEVVVEHESTGAESRVSNSKLSGS